jgi:hypothetical protein
MKQETFNKIITISLMLYCMTMFSASWWTDKPLDLQSFAILIAPLLTHISHIVTQGVLITKNGNSGGLKP